MRILLTSHGYPPTISGVTLVVQKLARALVRMGHDVTVLTGSERFTAYEAEDRGVRLVRVETRRNPYWAANPVPVMTLDWLERFLSRVRPDVIHCHDALPLCLPVTRARKRLDIPLVATCHYYPSFVASYVVKANRGQAVVEDIAWRYSVRLYNKVDHVVFATYTHRDEFVKHGLESHTHVISNGVDLTRYHAGLPPHDFASLYGLPSGRRVLTVGRLAKDKDIEVVIDAVARLDTSPPVHLLVVGEGPHKDALVAHARAQGAQARVHFLGFVPEADLPALYRASDVYAISSNHEVQSLPALQAAASAVPIVAVAQGSLPEICRDGENGILVPTGDSDAFAGALDAILGTPAAALMGQAGHRLSREHDERMTFAHYESLYQVAARHVEQVQPLRS